MHIGIGVDGVFDDLERNTQKSISKINRKVLCLMPDIIRIARVTSFDEVYGFVSVSGRKGSVDKGIKIVSIWT